MRSIKIIKKAASLDPVRKIIKYIRTAPGPIVNQYQVCLAASALPNNHRIIFLLLYYFSMKNWKFIWNKFVHFIKLNVRESSYGFLKVCLFSVNLIIF